MPIFTRFECPRCQHVFVTEGDADAFADCPKCQSMALAIGEATAGTVRGAPVSDEKPAPVSAEGFGARGDGDKGVFSQLLESTDSFPVQVDVSEERPRMPATLDDMPAASEEPADPFNEATVAADLPPSVLLTRMMADEATSAPGRRGPALASDEEDDDEDAVHRAPTEVLRPAAANEATVVKASVEQRTEDLGSPFSNDELDSAFDLPDPDEAAWENGPPPSVPTREPVAAAALDEDAWDDGPPAGVPHNPLPRPPITGEMPRRSNPAMDITRDDPGASDPDGFSLELHEERAGRHVGPGERRGVWDPNFHSGEMKAGAVLLSDLEAQFDGGVSLDQAAHGGDLSNHELSALEQAFSQMAGGTPQSRAEDALRQASLQAASSLVAMPTHSQLQGTAVPAPPAEGEPPSLSRRQRPAHLSLSEEAKALAGIPIQPPAGSQNLALELTRGAPEKAPPLKPRAPVADPLAESSAPVTRAPVRAVADADEAREVTDHVRPARQRPAAAPAEPGTFAGFTVMRVAALVLVAVLLGAGGGVLIAPKPEPKPTTPRTRAEQQFSQGNKFYAEGRFDDALGSYRGAIALDRTFAPAHRAKAAALAKQQRGDEAASAYRAYLEISPGAVDAEQVREVLRRYEGEAAP